MGAHASVRIRCERSRSLRGDGKRITSKPDSLRSKQSEVAGCSREQAGDRYLVSSAGAQKLSRPVSPRLAWCTKIKPSWSRRVNDFSFLGHSFSTEYDRWPGHKN